jgi:hypothetical protein
MDALTRAAVAGTCRETPPASGLPTDDLLGSAKGRSLQRNLLLRAGTRAVYWAAGRVAEAGIEAPQPAPDETLPACSAKAAELLRQLLVDQRNTMLLEALERLQLAGLRLPHRLLTAALNVQREELRPAVAAVLGKRGRWLAGFNPAWAWASVPQSGGIEDDKATWQESALPERLKALRRVRGRDAGQGLLMVEDVWKAEKADVRVAMIRALENDLRPEDEAFLERSLDDRGVRVREVAADLLARLSGSAYTARATGRADGVLVGYQAPPHDLLGRRRTGKLIVTPPEEVDSSWRRDLPGEKSQHRLGEKAWRISQTLSVVPPGHWEECFGVGPEYLIPAARGDWEAALLSGWCRATVAHRATSWAWPLWEHCYYFPRGREGEIVWDAALPLAGLLSSTDLAEAFPRMLENGVMPLKLANTLISLSEPWDEAFSDSYLAALRRMVGKAFSTGSGVSYWPDTLETAAERLSPYCLERSEVKMPDLPDDVRGMYLDHRRHWRLELEKFEETLELRRRIVKEIPL